MEKEDKVSFLSDLNPKKDFWNVKVRIIRLWKQKYTLDMVLLDEKGFKMQGCIKSHLWPVFESQLNEDEAVLISKCGVGEVSDKYDKWRVINWDFKINFYRCTTVTKIREWNGPEYGFNFISFKDIVEKKLASVSNVDKRTGLKSEKDKEQILTVDVVGSVVSCGNLDIYGPDAAGKVSKKINLELQDLEGRTLQCTLWDAYAEEFNTFIANNKSEEHVMAIIQHARVREWMGTVSVQNDKYGSRVFFNQEIDEVNSLRRSLILKQDGGSTSQSKLSCQPVYPLREEFLKENPKKHIEDILQPSKEFSCVVLATIKIVEEEYGWFYPACRKCSKKVVVKSEFLQQAKSIPDEIMSAPSNSLICPKCLCIATSITTKFKVSVRVQDGTGSVSFVMFDKEVQRILGISASDIRERQVNAGNTNTFPHELGRLVDKVLAFKIDISDYNLERKSYIYTVQKTCDDPDIITELAFKSEESHDEITEQENQGNAVRLSDSSQYYAEGSSKDVVSGTGESFPADTEKECVNSPTGKRSIDEVGNELLADHSCNSKRIRKKTSRFT